MSTGDPRWKDNPSGEDPVMPGANGTTEGSTEPGDTGEPRRQDDRTVNTFSDFYQKLARWDISFKIRNCPLDSQFLKNAKFVSRTIQK